MNIHTKYQAMILMNKNLYNIRRERPKTKEKAPPTLF
jgi:hypothetical protein